MQKFLLSSIIMALLPAAHLLGENESAAGVEVRLNVMHVDPYIFPAPNDFKAYVVSGFVRSSEISGGVNGMQSACVLVSADHLTPVPGAELKVTPFELGTAELTRLREEYNQFSKKLVGIYMQMPELSFFRLLDELPIDEQARIFSMMKVEDLARYLGMIGPQKARIMTSLLAKQRAISAVYVSAESRSLAALD